MSDIEKKPVFMVASSVNGPPVVTVGITRGCFESMLADRETRTLDLQVIGLPFRLMLFAGETHDACIKELHDAAAKANIPVLDMRRTDFSGRPKEDA